MNLRYFPALAVAFALSACTWPPRPSLPIDPADTAGPAVAASQDAVGQTVNAAGQTVDAAGRSVEPTLRRVDSPRAPSLPVGGRGLSVGGGGGLLR